MRDEGVALFQLCKPFAIYAFSFGLGDEGGGVDGLDESEEGDGLILLGDDHKDADGLTGVASSAGEEGGGTIHFLDDGVADVLRMLGDDEELDGLLDVVHHVVEHHVADEHVNESEGQALPIVKEGIGGSDDEDVEIEQHSSQTDVAVFVDHGCDDVGAARAALVEETLGKSHSADGGAEEHGHESLVLA